jgi:phage terminase large subunit-like protein
MALLPELDRAAILEQLSPKETKALLYDWPFWARPKQLAPPGDWAVWMLRSGRGFGKTRSGSEWVISRAKHGPYHPIALVGQTVADVRDTMIETGASSILKCSPPWFMPKYEPSKRRVTWPNGMIAITYSGDEPDQLRGPQHGSAWTDELAKYKYPQDTWDNLMLGLRVGDKPQAVVTTTPRPIPIIKQLLADPKTVDTNGSSYENMANLSPIFIQRIIQKYEGTRLGQQELHGGILGDVPGALWKRDVIERNRKRSMPELVRVVVAIDPEATSNEDSSETGIVVAGIGRDGDGYVLDDLSLRATPNIWATQAVSAYSKYHADRIIGEVNNGGEMIENTIRTLRDDDKHDVGKNVSYRAVHASRGKYTRAEPISALYEQNRVHHVGMFAELEDQQCSWVPGEKSPDRMDALVWALTELMVNDDQVWGNL